MKEFGITCFLFLLLGVRQGSCLKFLLLPGSEECLTEYVSEEHFQTVGAGEIEARILITTTHHVPEVSVELKGPDGVLLYTMQHAHNDVYVVGAANFPGRYTLCFKNEYNARAVCKLELAYFAMSHLKKPLSTSFTKPGKDAGDVKGRQLQGIQIAITSMAEAFQVISGELRYMSRRLERHHATVVSTNRRVFWWSVAEALALATVSALQALAITWLLTHNNRASPWTKQRWTNV